MVNGQTGPGTCCPRGLGTGGEVAASECEDLPASGSSTHVLANSDINAKASAKNTQIARTPPAIGDATGLPTCGACSVWPELAKPNLGPNSQEGKGRVCSKLPRFGCSATKMLEAPNRLLWAQLPFKSGGFHVVCIRAFGKPSALGLCRCRGLRHYRRAWPLPRSAIFGRS